MIKNITSLLFGILLFPLITISQEIKVIDKETNQGIEFVFVYNLNQTQSTISNHLGFFDSSIFQKNDTIILQHPSYKKEIYAVNSINKEIALQKRSIDLEQVIVTANKWEQNIKEVPNKIATIKAQEISFKNPQTSADLIGATGKVFIQKSQLGGGSPMIRGFSANSVLLVVDGVRMNNCIFRSGNLQNIINLDPNIISNSEIIFGPGSIIYGSDALGGVMDFHTKQPAFSYKPNHINVSAITRYSSANNEKTGHVDINYSAKKWAALTSITYSNYDDLRMGSNGNNDYTRNNYIDRINGIDSILLNSNSDVQKYSGYNQINLMQKVKYKASEHVTFDYGFHYSNSSNIPRYDRLIQEKNNELKYAEWYYGPQLWIMNNFFHFFMHVYFLLFF
ncbi:MAG: TonB-dependent receptor plug domain-containing protein [Bacteroidota bacterium]|nr:TonB-dependent receptor plug domain-containing protein [Bacteroidota bacterium]